MSNDYYLLYISEQRKKCDPSQYTVGSVETDGKSLETFLQKVKVLIVDPSNGNSYLLVDNRSLKRYPKIFTVMMNI